MPARLSAPKSPMLSMTCCRSSRVVSCGAEREFAVGEARFGQAAQVHDDFDQIAGAAKLLQGDANAFGQDGQEEIEVISYV